MEKYGVKIISYNIGPNASLQGAPLKIKHGNQDMLGTWAEMNARYLLTYPYGCSQDKNQERKSKNICLMIIT